jgi:hypothetical protein
MGKYHEGINPLKVRVRGSCIPISIFYEKETYLIYIEQKNDHSTTSSSNSSSTTLPSHSFDPLQKVFKISRE